MLGQALSATALLAYTATFTGPARAQDPVSDAPVSANKPLDETGAVQAGLALDVTEKGAYVELHRLRIVNQTDGAIQVSTDGGATWRLIGRVLQPASTAAQGYLAANYAKPGTIAATAVHGLRIRVSEPDASLPAPLVISIDPREYAGQVVNKGYGGHRPGSSGIFTDIPAGTSLFRDLAPLVGNPVLRQSESGQLTPLPPNFKPRGDGETLVIPVRVPRNALATVTFENKPNGVVEGTFADGTKRTLTNVVMPVRGVGRFDGTAYTGVGRLNTAHTGVITVSTAPVDGALPEGKGRERRGGFQISPAWHNAHTEEAGSPIALTLGKFATRQRDLVKELEGEAPLFRDAISLQPGASGETASSALVDMSVDNGPWEPIPSLIGSRPDVFTGAGLTRFWKAQGVKRTAKTGVTGFRLRLSLLSPERAKITADTVALAYQAERLKAAQAGRVPLVNGLLTVNANPTNSSSVAFVRMYVEGVVKGFTNVAPFAVAWDTTRVPDGEYLIEVEALNSTWGVLATTHRRVYVLNNPAPAPIKKAASPVITRK